jgi:predicted transposase YdaD
MKTDTIFYQLFQSFPSIFFELIQLPISEANNYRFDSVEVKQPAILILKTKEDKVLYVNKRTSV